MLAQQWLAAYFCQSPPQLQAEQYWYHAKKVGIVSASSIKSCTGPAVRQVVFTDVQITIQQKVVVLPVLRY